MTEAGRIESVKRLLRDLNRQGIRSRSVLEAIAAVPRERFVEAGLEAHAWEDRALPIAERQTISQPLVVALMTQALRLQGIEKVLEIGTGSGYQTAILCRLARSVVTVERHARLAELAAQRLANLGYHNVEVVVGDGSLGWEAAAPYDRILVTAAAPDIPPALRDQLADEDGARLVIPVGTADEQDLIVLERDEGMLARRNLGPVRFVPLIGEQGYATDQDIGQDDAGP